MPLLGLPSKATDPLLWLLSSKAGTNGALLAKVAAPLEAGGRSTLWVLQGEMATLPRSSLNPLPDSIGTPDATTCVAFLCASSHSVGCAHLDSPSQTPGLEQLCRQVFGEDEAHPLRVWLFGTFGTGDASRSLATAVANSLAKSSVPIDVVAASLLHLNSGPVEESPNRRWSLAKTCPRITGAVMRIRDETVTAAAFVDPASLAHVPLLPARVSRGCAGGEGDLQPITRVSSEPSASASSEAASCGPSWELTVTPVREALDPGMKEYLSALRHAPDDALRSISTSPDNEPPGFFFCMRAMGQFLSSSEEEHWFGSPAEDARFILNEGGEWERVT
jgi:hypothetical protein